MKGISERKLGQEEVAFVLGSFDAGEVQQMLRERCRSAALEFCIALIQQEVELLCGRAFSRKGDSLYHRGGSEECSVIVGDGKISIRIIAFLSSSGSSLSPPLPPFSGASSKSGGRWRALL
jgi:hypothetical protein